MNITDLKAARLWFQSRQSYRPTDTEFEPTIMANTVGRKQVYLQVTSVIRSVETNRNIRG
ncbi:MAG: hypothetical protein ACREPR_10640 [Brasilonema sp.]